MLATIVALIAAHVLSDFVLQSRWLIEHKRRPAVFGLHIAIVGLATLVLLAPLSAGGFAALLFVIAMHTGIDAIKIHAVSDGGPERAGHRRLVAFLLDQAAHLLSLLIAAALWPFAFAAGAWPALLAAHGLHGLLAGYAVIAGFVTATRAGGFAMVLFMLPFGAPPDMPDETDRRNDRGVPMGGAWIGWLERTLVFVFILIDQFAAIGFLITAKSVLRFQYTRRRSHSEIVIIGTLASFAWAIAAAEITRWALAALD